MNWKDLKIKFSNNDWLQVGVVFLLTRLLLVFLGVVIFSILPHPQKSPDKRIEEQISHKRIWNNFDSVWYLKLAAEGYPQKEFVDTKTENWGFMPLYSMLIYGGTKLLPKVDPFWIGVIISNLCTYLGLVVFLKLLKEKFAQGIDTIILILTCAGSFYLSTVYAEGLFMLLSAGIFYLTHKKKYAFALILAGFATITRIQGVLLFLIPGVELLLSKKWQVYRYIPIGVVALAPLIALMWYLYVTCGEPLAFIKIQNAWGSKDLFPLQGFLGLIKGDRVIPGVVNISFWVVSLAFVIAQFKKLPLSYVIFTVAFFLLSTSNEIVYGTTRYILTVFPIFIAICMCKRQYYAYFVFVNGIFLCLTFITFIAENGTFI